MSEKIYIALVSSNFCMNEEVTTYFEEKGVEIISYSKKLGILKLKSAQQLIAEELKYIDYAELDKEFNIIKKEEE